MQAAGRCLRAAPGKDRAYVVQARASDLAYHYEQRWLYQEIADVLHPQLVDLAYGSLRDLKDKVENLMERHHVATPVKVNVMSALEKVTEGDTCSLLLTGLPFEGQPLAFDDQAEWSSVFVPAVERELFLRVFNDYSWKADEVRQPADFLRSYLEVDPRPGSAWQRYRDMLASMDYARKELIGDPYFGAGSRPYVESKGTTWLKYVTLRFEPAVPEDLAAFLADSVNREQILGVYVDQPERWRWAAKVNLPLGATYAFLLDEDQVAWIDRERGRLAEQLRSVRAENSFGELRKWVLQLESCPLPLMLLERFDVFLTDATLSMHRCELNAPTLATAATTGTRDADRHS